MRSPTLGQKGLMLLALPLALQLILPAWLTVLHLHAEQSAIKIAQAREVSDSSNAVMTDIGKLSDAVYQVVEGHDSKVVYIECVEALNHDFEHLKSLTPFRFEHPDLIEQLDSTRNGFIEFAGSLLNESGSAGKQKLKENKNRIKSYIEKLSQLLAKATGESSHFDTASSYQRERNNSTKVLIIFTAVDAVLFLLLGLLFRRHIIDRLTVITDNSRRLAEGSSLNPLLTGGDEIAHLDRVFHDMAAALTNASRKLRASIMHASDMICSLDSDFAIVNVNRASESLLGDEPESTLGKSLIDFIVEADRAHALRQLAAIIDGDSQAPFEARIRHANGQEIAVAWSAVWSAEDRTIFCIAHDITERKQAERLQKDVMQMVSHDLRSPLTAIGGIISLFKEGAGGDLDEESEEMFALADRNANLMKTLVEDILDIERLDAGMLELHHSRASINELFDQAVQTALVAAKNKNIKIESLSNNLTVYADADRLIQVISNLLGNAIKFSQNESTVELTARDLADNIEFEVKDSGRGIPSHMLDSIFDRFRQVKASDTEHGGKGLGLSICKALVELHGGAIFVESEPGKGSSFFFRIPNSKASSESHGK